MQYRGYVGTSVIRMLQIVKGDMTRPRAGKWKNQDLNPGSVDSASGSFGPRRRSDNTKTMVLIYCTLRARN